ncbi:NUMOD1 domain-containing DNA-binding protein [Vibrio rotiferianus]|uniref:NUMOD1 domain-containing DNA-binding protein n=1 Tax=Vibrio rotiferianus TaxID=190895 RepID=UPI00406A2292
MKNKENLVVNGLSFITRTEAARYFNITPKLVTERMNKRGWTLEQALELEPSPSRTYSKKVVIDGTEYSSMRQAARELGVSQSTLMNRIKSGIGVEEALSAAHTEREKLKGQSKPMFCQGKLYPSARHLLLANPDLVAGGDLSKAITSLNDKARRAKGKGVIENLSIDELSTMYGLPKPRFVDEFDGWVTVLNEVEISGLFYEMMG